MLQLTLIVLQLTIVYKIKGPRTERVTPLVVSQQTQDIEPMLFKCWPTVCDAGPTLKQHRFNVLCRLDIYSSKNTNFLDVHPP